MPDPLEPATSVKAVETRIVVTGGYGDVWLDPGSRASDDVDDSQHLMVSGSKQLFVRVDTCVCVCVCACECVYVNVF